MLDASARLLRLLTLLSSRRFWSGPDLAERLEVGERTLRRDVNKLRSLGYEVRSTPGLAGGYQLGPGSSLPPLSLDSSEALAVVVGLRTAAVSSVSGVESAAARALAKLEQVLPPGVRRQARALGSTLEPMHFGRASVDAEALGVLAAACRDRELLTFGYEDRKGKRSERQVEPHGLVCAGSRWYLAAWDRNREGFRSFRVDRLSQPTPTREGFAARPLPGGSARAYVSDSLSSAQYETVARVILYAPLRELAPRLAPSAGHLEALDDERCLLVLGGYNLRKLGLYIGLFDCDFEVVEPPEFRRELEELAQRFTRAARSAPLGGTQVKSAEDHP